MIITSLLVGLRRTRLLKLMIFCWWRRGKQRAGRADFFILSQLGLDTTLAATFRTKWVIKKNEGRFYLSATIDVK